MAATKALTKQERVSVSVLRDLQHIWPEAGFAPPDAKEQTLTGCSPWIVRCHYPTKPLLFTDAIKRMKITHGLEKQWLLVHARGSAAPHEVHAVHPFRPSDARLGLPPTNITEWRPHILNAQAPVVYVLWEGQQYLLWLWDAWLHNHAPLGIHAALFPNRKRRL